MKRNSLMILVALTLVLLISAYSRTTQSGTIKKEDVTAQTLASQPAGKPYVLDITRSGTVYIVSAEVASRVRVRTFKGEMAVSDLARELSLTGSQFLLGTARDLSSRDFGFPGGVVFDPGGSVSPAKTNQNGTLAACKGKATGKDCQDMQKAYCDGRAFACGTLGSGWGKGYAGQQGCGCTTSKYGKV